MVFPNVPANTPFNTVGMKAPINIEKYNNQGHLIESFKNVPPGIQSLPTGSQEGIVIETPANMQRGGVKPAPRMGTRKNADGTESTHLYATETLDGKNWVAFPTLFQNPDSSWIDMSGSEWYPAYQEALKRGEVIDFGKRKNKALKWGEGSWKNSMQTGGQRSPIYTDNPKDSRLQAYNDSLSLYNITREIENPKYYYNGDPAWYYFKGTAEEAEKFARKNNIDYTYEYYRTGKFPGRIQPEKTGDWGEGMEYPIYKRPTQPVIYRELSRLTPKEPTQIQVDTNKSLQESNREEVRTRPSQTIFRQDPSVSKGQYPVGERVWDTSTRSWKTDMWDAEMQKDSRELAVSRQERWRTIDIPKGGFQTGGTKKYLKLNKKQWLKNK
jgi:hypothetical protein